MASTREVGCSTVHITPPQRLLRARAELLRRRLRGGRRGLVARCRRLVVALEGDGLLGRALALVVRVRLVAAVVARLGILERRVVRVLVARGLRLVVVVVVVRVLV